MAFADLNGVRLHYQLDGDAALPPLLLSNSLGSSIALWDAQMPSLTEHFHVLRYDTRGHGQSSVPPGPYSLDQLGSPQPPGPPRAFVLPLPGKAKNASPLWRLGRALEPAFSC